MTAAVWYPAAIGTREARWHVSVFDAGWNAQGAPLAAGPRGLPLVVVSHGTGGGAASMSWLAETLASNGYVVAAVNHHGNTAAEPSYQIQGFMLWWERARDMSVLIDKVLADPRFGPHVDRARIGVAGFSVGGYTALAAAGARLEYEQWKSFCASRPADPNCTLPPEAPFSWADAQKLLDHDERVREAVSHAHESFRDARIRAALAIAPVLGPALTKTSLAGIRVPVRIVVGSKDDQAAPDVNARPIAATIPDSELDVIPDIAHYTFLAKCRLFGKVVARSICSDPGSVDRDAVHRKVGVDALAFFNRAMGAAAAR